MRRSFRVVGFALVALALVSLSGCDLIGGLFGGNEPAGRVQGPNATLSDAWDRIDGVVLSDSAVTQTVWLQESGEPGFARIDLTLNGLADIAGTELMIAGATGASTGLFPVEGPFTGDGFKDRFTDPPASFVQEVDSSGSVSWSFLYVPGTDPAGWPGAVPGAEMVFTVRYADDAATSGTTEYHTRVLTGLHHTNFYVAGVGANNVLEVQVDMDATGTAQAGGPLDFASLTSFSIIGAATENGWSTDTNMTLDVDSGTYAITADLNVGEYKFRGDADWANGLGVIDLPDGTKSSTLFLDGGNLSIDEAGSWTISVNTSTYAVTATRNGAATGDPAWWDAVPKLGFWGDAGVDVTSEPTADALAGPDLSEVRIFNDATNLYIAAYLLNGANKGWDNALYVLIDADGATSGATSGTANPPFPWGDKGFQTSGFAFDVSVNGYADESGFNAYSYTDNTAAGTDISSSLTVDYNTSDSEPFYAEITIPLSTLGVSASDTINVIAFMNDWDGGANGEVADVVPDNTGGLTGGDNVETLDASISYTIQ